MLPDRADPQPDGRLEEDDVGEDDDGEHQPDEQVQVPEDALEEVADPGNRAEEVEVDVGDARDVLMDYLDRSS